jgi:hypothetical protein
MNLEVLPLAITMMAGPQIMSAIILITTDRPVAVSAGFVAGVAIATAAGTAIALGLAGLAGDSLGKSGERGSLGHVIQYVLVGLLAIRAVQAYLGRESAEPPKWLGLLSADWKRALRTGLLLILVMPSDIVVMLTVAVNLEQHDASYVDALPFIAATVLVAALPLMLYVVFRRRAQNAMPKVRRWISVNSWLVNILICCLFIVLILR